MAKRLIGTDIVLEVGQRWRHRRTQVVYEIEGFFSTLTKEKIQLTRKTHHQNYNPSWAPSFDDFRRVKDEWECINMGPQTLEEVADLWSA